MFGLMLSLPTVQGCKFCIFGQPGCEPKKSRSPKPKKKGGKKRRKGEKIKKEEEESGISVKKHLVPLFTLVLHICRDLRSFIVMQKRSRFTRFRTPKLGAKKNVILGYEPKKQNLQPWS